jgi:hypothetical protein
VIAVHTRAVIVDHIARRAGPQSSEAAPTQEVAMKKESRECRRLHDGSIWVFIEGRGWTFLEVRR